MGEFVKDGEVVPARPLQAKVDAAYDFFVGLWDEAALYLYERRMRRSLTRLEAAEKRKREQR